MRVVAHAAILWVWCVLCRRPELGLSICPHHTSWLIWLSLRRQGLVSQCVWLSKGVYYHDDVMKWKYFLRYWSFVRIIHRSPVNSPHKGQWRGALMFSLICVWTKGWVHNRDAVIWDAIAPIMTSLQCTQRKGLGIKLHFLLYFHNFSYAFQNSRWKQSNSYHCLFSVITHLFPCAIPPQNLISTTITIEVNALMTVVIGVM